MAEQDKPFVINDRRKFRMDGELREPAPERAPEEVSAKPEAVAAHAGPVPDQYESSAKVISFADAAHREHEHPTEKHVGGAHSSEPIPINSAHMITPVPGPGENGTAATRGEAGAGEGEENLPPAPTAEEIAQVDTAYQATAERLETVMRATNPGGEHLPPMDFLRMVQSIYMSAMMQLGAGTPQGEQARVDLLGAKQSIDMLGVVSDKSQGNLNETEERLIESALFELRMGFLEITQLLARQAQAKQGAPGASPFGAGPGANGPRIVS